MKTLFTILFAFNCLVYSQPEWAVVPSGTTSNLNAIWGTSPDNIYAVGNGGVVLHFDGTNWAQMNAGISENLVSMIGFSANEIYALSSDAVYKFNGISWSVFNAAQGGDVIWGTSGNDLYVGGGENNQSGSGFIFYYNGNQWVKQTTFFGFNRIRGLNGISSTEVYAGGNDGRIYHRKDCNQTGNYTWETTNFSLLADVYGVWVAGVNDAFCVREFGSAAVYRYTGQLVNGDCYKEVWNEILYSPSSYDLFKGILGFSNSKIYVFGSRYRVPAGTTTSLIYEYDGLDWRVMTTQTDSINFRTIFSLWGPDTSNVFAVGEKGLILKLHGKTSNHFIVNTTADKPDISPSDGICDCGGPLIDDKPECSLNAVIMEANTSEEKDSISFDIPQSDPGYNPNTKSYGITTFGSLNISQPVIIDGTTQKDYAGSPVIEIDFGDIIPKIKNREVTELSMEDNKSVFITSGNTTIRGLAIYNSPVAAIWLFGKGNNKIEANYIGTDAAGNLNIGNKIGILIDSSPDNTIGGKSQSKRNIISSNLRVGVNIAGNKSTGNSIMGNFIGTNIAGTGSLGNETGIKIDSALNNIIGGSDPGMGNVISGNTYSGIRLEKSDSNKVTGNNIGLDPSGSFKVSNKRDGVYVINGKGNKIFGNKISGNEGRGISITGSLSKGIVIKDNMIGEKVINTLGGIYITNNASEIDIGGYNTGESNKIYDGILIDYPTCKKISVENNFLEIPDSWADGASLKVPLDLAETGPTNNPWNGGEGTNNQKSPPRILKLLTNEVTGMTRANEKVEVYKVLKMGVGRGRYFARSVEPLGHVQADDKGYFSISLTLSNGEMITATSTDAEGNTSELAQIKRPVIFVPGIGGSWLNGANGDQLWLPAPLAGTDWHRDNLMFRLSMNADGSSIENIKPNGVLEYLAGVNVSYGEIMDKITASGYTGDKSIWLDSKGTGGSTTTDLYRFPNDWRKDQFELAKDLKDRVEWLTSDNILIARSLEVDIVCHSNGGVISSAYMRGFPEHSQSRVYRFIAIAIPYLGANKAIAGHTKGYVFEIDTELPYLLKVGSYSPNWSKMIQMSRNLPASYSLIPSKLFWEASNHLNPEFGEAFLYDLSHKALKSYNEVFDFLTRPKNLGGLGRNKMLFQSVGEKIHDYIDDWRDWNGPPHIFRFAGNKPHSTPVGWHFFPKSIRSFPRRSEPGDTPEIIKYRSTQVPILGRGDETVPLSSATLGRGPSVGKVDFSGVQKSDQTKNPWIEEFEYFPCSHNGLLTNECVNESGKSLLDRVVEILKGGYIVQSPSTQLAGMKKALESPEDLLYIFANAPIGVHITDSEGRHTGPVSPDSIANIEYFIPDIGYWPNDLAAAVSMPNGETYNISIYSPVEETTIQVVRIISNSENDYRNVIFPEQKVSTKGGIQFNIQSGATPENLSLDVDVDGDNNYESKLDPGIVLNSTSPVPALPVPQPYYINESAFETDSLNKEIVISFGNTGDGIWKWEMESYADWINVPDSGLTSSNPQITILSKNLSAGNYLDTVFLRLSYNNFLLSYPVSVQITVFNERTLTGIQLSPEYIYIIPGDSVKFIADGYDQAGDSIEFSEVWNAEGGTIDNTGLFIAGNSLGTFPVAVTDPVTQIVAHALVNISDIVGVTEELKKIPTDYYLYNNYPNPFNPSTKIRYAIPFASDVTIKIFNILGEQMVQLISEVQNPGIFEINWDAAALASGVYFYMIEAKQFESDKVYRDVKKMILVK